MVINLDTLTPTFNDVLVEIHTDSMKIVNYLLHIYYVQNLIYQRIVLRRCEYTVQLFPPSAQREREVKEAATAENRLSNRNQTNTKLSTEKKFPSPITPSELRPIIKKDMT